MHELDAHAATRALWQAVAQGDPEGVRQGLAAGADLRVTDQDGGTPLHQAAQKGPVEVVNLLLAADADPQATDQKGRTPLHQAAESGHVEVVNLLLETGRAAYTSDG